MVISTGKEVELFDVSRKQALKLKIASASGYDGMDVFYDAALYGTRLAKPEFEARFTDEEIIEIAGLVFKNMNVLPEQKKS